MYTYRYYYDFHLTPESCFFPRRREVIEAVAQLELQPKGGHGVVERRGLRWVIEPGKIFSCSTGAPVVTKSWLYGTYMENGWKIDGKWMDGKMFQVMVVTPQHRCPEKLGKCMEHGWNM